MLPPWILPDFSVPIKLELVCLSLKIYLFVPWKGEGRGRSNMNTLTSMYLV